MKGSGGDALGELAPQRDRIIAYANREERFPLGCQAGQLRRARKIGRSRARVSQTEASHRCEFVERPQLESYPKGAVTQLHPAIRLAGTISLS